MKRLSLLIAVAVALPCILFGTYALGGTDLDNDKWIGRPTSGVEFYKVGPTEVLYNPDDTECNDVEPDAEEDPAYPDDSDVVLSNVRVIRVHLTGKDYCAAKTTVGKQTYFAEAESNKINTTIACSMFVSALENGRSLELVGTMDGPRHIKVRNITYGLARQVGLDAIANTTGASFEVNKVGRTVQRDR